MAGLRQSLVCKILAFLLATAALVALVFSGAGVIYNLDAGGYGMDEATYAENRIVRYNYSTSYETLQRYVQRTYGDKDDPALESFISNWRDSSGLTPGVDYEYEIRSLDGALVDSLRTDANVIRTLDDVLTATYFKGVPYYNNEERFYESEDETEPFEEFQEAEQQIIDNEKNGWYFWEHYYDETGTTKRVLGKESNRYYVKIFYLEPSLATMRKNLESTPEYWVYHWRNEMMTILPISAVLLLLTMCYLFWAVDHRRGEEQVAAWGINRIPLDVSAGVCLILGSILAMVEVDFLIKELFWNDLMEPLLWILTLGVAWLGSMLIVGWLVALAAQIRQGGGFWWRNALAGRFLRWCWRMFWKVWILLPLMWHWLLSGAAFLLVLFFAMAMESGFLVVLDLLAAIALIVYNGIGYGKLLQGVQRMSQGHLDEPVELGRYTGQYRVFAENLNSLADAAMEAARKQTASERMRTELITNVSHDIKTPLTSIVNYVDLLQKPHTPEEEQRYLEVLGRQSLRMKKLVEDLVEMSKATTGNLTVAATRLDVVEMLHQSLGEFSERLEKVPLTPVLQLPEEPVPVMADGRLVWRVLSNLLSNTVKYAMPGTRFYVTVQRSGKEVSVSLKNISRDPLNISAEELMERFVRGDTSRNTEGSGLGLNIAQSLMEAQGGELELFVEGDLFMATIRLPGA